jgi:hypothetical protein
MVGGPINFRGEFEEHLKVGFNDGGVASTSFVSV